MYTPARKGDMMEEMEGSHSCSYKVEECFVLLEDTKNKRKNKENDGFLSN